MYQILKNILARLTTEEKIEMLKLLELQEV